MSLYPPLPPRQPSFPSGRYTRTDPLRREFGLKLLSEPLPEPLRTSLIRAWRRPVRYDGKQAIQSLHRQRPDEAALPLLPPSLLGVLSLTELEVSRRVVETPRTSISRDTRNKLLKRAGRLSACPLCRACLPAWRGLLPWPSSSASSSRSSNIECRHISPARTLALPAAFSS